MPLFLVLIGEVFNRMVMKAKKQGLIKGLVVERDKVEITHLQFANDMLIFSLPSNDFV